MPTDQDLPNEQPFDRDVDALIEDVKSLLDGAAEAEPGEPEAQEPAGPEHPADDVPPAPEPDPAPPLTFYEQSKIAYQRRRRDEYRRMREQERLARARQRQELEREDLARMRQMDAGKKKNRPRRTAAEYAEWLYQQGLGQEPVKHRQEQSEPPKRRGGFGRVLLAVLVLIVLAAGVLHFFVAKMPKGPSGQERRSGCTTILVAGTDEGGYRTDTMLLVRVDRGSRQISLVSIPRDTLIFCEYTVPKLNSAYGWASGGERGIEELMTRVTEIVGFRPDGYLLADLRSVESVIDQMGGVTFDVPVRMAYSDPSQGLVIDLQPGVQHLTGAQALQVLRFRSGYADADLGRIQVQRALIAAAVDQWVSLKGLIHLPDVMELLQNGTNTDLSRGNLLWLAESCLLCDRSSISSATLPGRAEYLTGAASGSYYVLDPRGVAEMVNELCNPYVKGVSAEDLSIRVG